MNAQITEWLRRDGVDVADWYPGRPLLVTVNSYTLRLFNGDVGIALEDDEGRLAVAFPGEGGTWRRFAPARLPSHEPAFAFTVHKSQGSEFDTVLLLVPPGDNPVVSRNLLYTAITRAKIAVFDLGVGGGVAAGDRAETVEGVGAVGKNADRVSRNVPGRGANPRFKNLSCVSSQRSVSGGRPAVFQYARSHHWSVLQRFASPLSRFGGPQFPQYSPACCS